jgi:hypothetical protein
LKNVFGAASAPDRHMTDSRVETTKVFFMMVFPKLF